MPWVGGMAWDTAGAWDLGDSGFHPHSDVSCLSEPARMEPMGDAGTEALLPTQVKSQLLHLCYFHQIPWAQFVFDDRRHVACNTLTDMDRRGCHPRRNQMQGGMS